MQIPYRKPGKFSQMKQDPLLTQAKFNELKNNLERLKKIRPEAAAEVARLAELGDFSENAEYQLAKSRLRGINNRILFLEQQLSQAVIIPEPQGSSTVQIGSKVTVEVGGVQKVYKILGSTETNPQLGIISYNSPIGEALVGCVVGDVAKIKLVNKEVEYKIMLIE